jgi:hypothetical protein
MIFFGLDLSKVYWSLIIYVIVSVAGMVYGVRRIYETGQVRATIFAVGGLLVLVYFGFRWFGTNVVKPKRWPPVINMCPDYLTYIPKLPGCIDMLGVTTGSAGLVKTLPSDVLTLQKSNSNKVFEYTSEDVKDAKQDSDLQNICNRCQAAGVTWEGVYDGDTCVGIARKQEDNADKENGECLVST